MSLLTIDGCPFDPSQTAWRITTSTDQLLFNFDLPLASQGMRDDLRAALARLMRAERPEFVHQALKSCRVLMRHTARRRGSPVDVFDTADFETYRDQLSGSRDQAVIMLDTLKKLAAVGFDRYADDLRIDLYLLRVVAPPKASPANLGCRRRGALTLNELQFVMSRLTEAYKTGRLSLDDYALGITGLALSPRPSQAAALKTRDLIVTPVNGDAEEYSITMPMVKLKRFGMPPPRAVPRRLHPNVGIILAKQCVTAIAWGAERGIVADDCPMFPFNTKNTRPIAWPALPWTVGHSTASNLSCRAIKAFEVIDLSSMRNTGEEQVVTFTRLRRTLSTIARATGSSYEQVGELIWHSGGASAHVYCGPSIGTIERVEKAIDFQPLAAACRSELEAMGVSIGGPIP